MRHRCVIGPKWTAILNLHERIENNLFLDRTRKDSNFKRPHICATLFQIEKCWCFNPVDPELDPSSCGNARAAPSTRAGRERGRNGTGRTLAFPSKKRTSCGSGWLLIAL